MTTTSTDYHQYIFRRGRFIGDFEAMYRHSEEVPWHQDRTAFSIGADIDIAIMKAKRYRTICDVGCGLGYFTNRLRTELKSPQGEPPAVTGLDMAPTAINNASSRFPGIRFDVCNFPHPPGGMSLRGVDLVVARDVLWYVCADLRRFLDSLTALVRAGGERGFVHVTQSFPSGDEWVGKDVIGSADTLLCMLAARVTVLYSCLERDRHWGGACVLHAFGSVT